MTKKLKRALNKIGKTRKNLPDQCAIHVGCAFARHNSARAYSLEHKAQIIDVLHSGHASVIVSEISMGSAMSIIRSGPRMSTCIIDGQQGCAMYNDGSGLCIIQIRVNSMENAAADGATLGARLKMETPLAWRIEDLWMVRRSDDLQWLTKLCR